MFLFLSQPQEIREESKRIPPRSDAAESAQVGFFFISFEQYLERFVEGPVAEVKETGDLLGTLDQAFGNERFTEHTEAICGLSGSQKEARFEDRNPPREVTQQVFVQSGQLHQVHRINLAKNLQLSVLVDLPAEGFKVFLCKWRHAAREPDGSLLRDKIRTIRKVCRACCPNHVVRLDRND